MQTSSLYLNNIGNELQLTSKVYHESLDTNVMMQKSSIRKIKLDRDILDIKELCSFNLSTAPKK